MKPIGDDIRRELRRFPGAAGMAAIVSAWPAAVGDAVARNAWPAKLARDGTLHVSTGSSAWAFELTQLRGEVLARLQQATAGEAVVAGLRFAPGPLPAPDGVKAPLEASPAGPETSPEALAEAERMAAAVGDETLRNLIARAAAASLSKAPDDRPFC